MKRCKVLILCGGGIFGVIPTHFLSMLPENEQNLNKIDALGGCSIGGALTCAYAVGQEFTYIDKIFQRRAKECFTKRCVAKINPLASPTYRADTLDKVFHDMIGNKLVSYVKEKYPNLNIVVPALDITNDVPVTFENITGKWDNLKLKKIAQCTSAAPSYYEGRELDGNCIVDGGVIDVDAILTTVVTLKNELKIPFEAMDVFSLGTGEDIDPNPLTVKRYNSLNLLGVATDVLVPYVVLSNKMWGKQICTALDFHHFNYFNPIKINGKLDEYEQIPDLVKEADKHRDEFLEAYNYWLTL